MDSSLLELKEALALITEFNQHWNFDSNGADAAGLSRASQCSRRISESFAEVNGTLQEGWYTTANLFYKIQGLVSEYFGEMYKDILLFTDESYQNELKAKEAVDEATSLAGDILNDLGIGEEGSGAGGSGSGQ